MSTKLLISDPMGIDLAISSRAYGSLTAKLDRARELGLDKPKTPEEIEQIILDLSTTKAEREGKPLSKVIRGQEWYLKQLVHVASPDCDRKSLLNEEINRGIVGSSTIDELYGFLAAY